MWPLIFNERSNKNDERVVKYTDTPHLNKPWQARIAMPISRVCVWLVNLALTIEVYLHEGDTTPGPFDLLFEWLC